MFKVVYSNTHHQLRDVAKIDKLVDRLSKKSPQGDSWREDIQGIICAKGALPGGKSK